DDAAGANGACDQIEDGAAFGRDCAVKVGKEAMLNGIVSKTAGEFCPEVTRDARDDFPFISGGGSVEARENRRDCGIFKREARVHESAAAQSAERATALVTGRITGVLQGARVAVRWIVVRQGFALRWAARRQNPGPHSRVRCCGRKAVRCH